MSRITPIYGQLTRALGADLSEATYRAQTVFHAGLVVERYLPSVVQDRGLHPQFNSEDKSPWLRTFAKKASEAWKAGDAPWRKWAERHEEMLNGWTGIEKFVLRPRWRWVIGLGNQTILETGITLHHTYGVPFIPGSALKGLAQALAELEPPTGVDADMKRAIFGEQDRTEKDRAGEVVFLGAMPAKDSPPRLVVDVMTPHCPKYYAGSRDNPLEIEDPSPVPFLCVAGGEYQVAVAPRRSATALSIVKTASELCKTALKDMGIGSKTAKGYGYFLELQQKKGG